MAPALAHANCLQFTPPNPQPTLSASWTGALGAMNAAAQGEGENLNTPNFANALGANTELAGFRPVLVMVDESSSFGETDYEAALRSLQQRVGTFRVVEKDDPVPARLFELINNAPRPGGLCSLAPTLSGCRTPDQPTAHVVNYALPSGAADAARRPNDCGRL